MCGIVIYISCYIFLSLECSIIFFFNYNEQINVKERKNKEIFWFSVFFLRNEIDTRMKLFLLSLKDIL